MLTHKNIHNLAKKFTLITQNTQKNDNVNSHRLTSPDKMGVR